MAEIFDSKSVKKSTASFLTLTGPLALVRVGSYPVPMSNTLFIAFAKAFLKLDRYWCVTPPATLDKFSLINMKRKEEESQREIRTTEE
jgi:hypothetical protein